MTLTTMPGASHAADRCMPAPVWSAASLATRLALASNSWRIMAPNLPPLGPPGPLGSATPSSSSSPNAAEAAVGLLVGLGGRPGRLLPLGAAVPGPCSCCNPEGARLSTMGVSSVFTNASPRPAPTAPSMRAILRARSTCMLISVWCRSSSSFSATLRFNFFSSSISCMGSFMIKVMYQPFSVSSTLHLPSRPRCLTKSVSVSQQVEFMCT
mmetsp:Transcript_10395/g.18092  ORF Transcript_10395/g.18092 Transcript_10395/m.18092 type:complete len:211 (-) Transcript_10395:380-1012(-)